MCNNKELQFECSKCGSNELGYQKYAKCIAPVSLQENGGVEYGQSVTDEDDYLATLNGFTCKLCGNLIEHCGIRMETEKELLDYLSMMPQVRQQQEQEYEELLGAQISAQEEQECY